uniref:CSD domain-containing protein n=1 Tax=Scleropages formosus TaxID=113540 RepID=A0A8C9WFF0_SCLFO
MASVQVVTTKVLGTVKWLNVKNGYGFIKSWHDGSLCPLLKMAIKKNNPRKYLRSVGNGETVAFDMVEGEKVSLPVGLGYPSTRSKYAADRNHYRQYPRQQGPQHTYPGNCPNGGSKTTEESDGLQAEASASQQRRPTYPSQHRYPPTWSTCPTAAGSSPYITWSSFREWGAKGVQSQPTNVWLSYRGFRPQFRPRFVCGIYWCWDKHLESQFTVTLYFA